MDTWIHRGDTYYGTLLEAYSRTLTGALPLRAFGIVTNKKSLYDVPSPTGVSACFVTEGDGFVEVDGVHQDVSVPFVMLVRPGRRFRYGPASRWTEVYCQYFVPLGAFLDHWQLTVDAPSAWPMRNLDEACAIINIMRRVCSKPNLHNSVDLVDRLAESLILLTLHGSSGSIASSEHLRILQAEAYIRENFTRDIGIEDLAEHFGFSKAGLYRHWNAVFASSPNELVISLRLEACRRSLIESEAPVKEIARAAGFNDPRYCERLFEKRFGLTPFRFRKVYSHGPY